MSEHDQELVLAAANRIMHMDYEGTREEDVLALAEDANLVAGAYVLLVLTEPVKAAAEEPQP